MIEKTEWEVVDEPRVDEPRAAKPRGDKPWGDAPRFDGLRGNRAHPGMDAGAGMHAGSHAAARQATRRLLESLLGRGWRWKAAGMAVVAGVILVLMATVAAAMFVVAAAGALAFIVTGTVRKWLHRGSGARSAVTRFGAGE